MRWSAVTKFVNPGHDTGPDPRHEIQQDTYAPRLEHRELTRTSNRDIMRPVVLTVPETPENFLEWLSTRVAELHAKAAESGAVWLRGLTALSKSLFEQFAPVLLGGTPIGYQGGDSLRERLSAGVYTSTSFPARENLPLHNELSYSNRFPARLVFGCITPAAQGGNTPLCDGRELLNRMPQDFVQDAVECGLRYTQRLHSGSGCGKSWMDTFESSDRGEVEAWLAGQEAQFSWDGETLVVSEVAQPVLKHPATGQCSWFAQIDQWHPASLDEEVREILECEGNLYHNVTLGDGRPIPDGIARQQGTLSHELCWSQQWERGDLLLVDNLTCLHGREPFSGGPREILVSML